MQLEVLDPMQTLKKQEKTIRDLKQVGSACPKRFLWNWGSFTPPVFWDVSTADGRLVLVHTTLLLVVVVSRDGLVEETRFLSLPRGTSAAGRRTII